jgi:MerR family redox-sensitive transcriptional activator SoxR
MSELLGVGAVAARSGVAVSTLHYYETRGLIASLRSGGNQRRYRRDVLRRIAFIRAAQQVGIGLDEIALALSALPQQRAPTKADWTQLSKRWRDQLTARIDGLQRLRDQLDGCIGCGCLSLKSCRLYNHDDALGRAGSGARRWVGAG